MLRLPEPEEVASQGQRSSEGMSFPQGRGQPGASAWGEPSPPVRAGLGGGPQPERPGRHRGGARRARNPLFQAIPGGGEGGDAPVEVPAFDEVGGEQLPGAPDASEAASAAWSLLGGWDAMSSRFGGTAATGAGGPPGGAGAPPPAGGRRASPGVAGGQGAECYACPIGALFSEARGARPETMAHLLTAAQELTAAARSLLEGLETALGRTQGASAAKVQRITLG